jgi:hypothetical protein
VRLALAAAWLAASSAAAEERPSARLDYRADADAGCPDERAIADQVAARLGYDPFRRDAATTVRAIITREGRGLRARIEIRDAGGGELGARQLGSSRDCAELVSAAALAISIALDPLQAKAQPPLPKPPECPTCPVCPPPAPPPRDPVRFRVAAGLQAGLGAVPSVGSLGITVQARLDWRSFSLALEGRADPRLGGADAPAGGRVDATLLLALLAPCAHLKVVLACALVAAGALQGEGIGLASPNRQTTFYAAAGARLGVELPLPHRLSVGLHLDGLAPLVRTTLQVDGRDVWVTPPFSGALGVDFGAHLP